MRTTFTNTQKDKNFMDAVIHVMLPKKQEQINEKLEDHEAEEVEYEWDHSRPFGAEEAIHKTFGDKDRIEIPFTRGDAIPHPDVEEHLNKHGYQVSDYLNGKAKDKYGRETNIGKALAKTNASEQIKNTFENDPERQQKSKSNMKIVISHRPTDVAGMTSCGHSWEDSSCMNFKSGSNRGYLPYEVSRGTHVAYLTHKDDNDLNHPIARIAAKPFIEHESGEEHTIFRPEGKVYGETPYGFHSTVSDWFNKHYPGREGVQYHKDKSVYNDDGKDIYSELSHKEIDDRLEHGNIGFKTQLPERNIEYIKNKLVSSAEAGNPHMMKGFTNLAPSLNTIKFSRNQANELYSAAAKHGIGHMTNYIAGKYGHLLNQENLKHTLSTYKSLHDMHYSVAAHKYLPKEVIDNIPTSMIGYLHKSNVNDTHVQRAIDSYKNHDSGSSYILSDIYDKLRPEHLKELINHEIISNNPSKTSSWLGHKNANEEVINHAFNQIKNAHEPHQFMTYFNRHNPNPTPEHVAITDSVGGLNDIMENAKDKTTHNLAFYKAHELKSKNRQYIALGNNSEKYIGETELEHIRQHPNNYNGDLAHMSDKIHSDLLHHHIKHINKLADEHENEEDEDKKAELEGKIDEHLENHASLIDDRLSDHRKYFREGGTVNHKNLETLRDHIDAALEHPHHYHTHDEVDADHNDLMKEIEGRW